MNFARDVVEAGDPGRRGMVTIARDGARREWTMGEVAAGARALAAELGARGVARGDVVLTLLGNRPEWVLTMVACFRAGFVVLPCTEQLRPKDLRLRLDGRAAPARRRRRAQRGRARRRRLGRAGAVGAVEHPAASGRSRRPPSSDRCIRA